MTRPALSPVAESVRRHDPDRFLAALFAPARARETLLLLAAFNHELARAREVASQPTLALIRLQWWREVVEGTRRRHEVAGPLGEALDAGRLHAPDLAAMIDAREAQADEAGIASLAAWRDHVRGTAGGFAVAAGRLLGADAPLRERLAALGTAYGVAGHLRSVAALARQGRCLLPRDLLGAHGLVVEGVVARPDDARLAPVRAELAAWAQGLLAVAGGAVPRHALAAALPAVLARRDLRQRDLGSPAAEGPRRFGDRAAMLLAFLAGRV
jgi:15-cis-phytoene synthase